MKIYVNDRMEIKDVNSTTNTSLIEKEVTDGTFDDWSIAKICCYKADVRDGQVVMMTPYVNTIILEQLDKLSITDKANADNIDVASDAVIENYENVSALKEQADTQADAILELYEMIGGSN